MPGTQRTRPDGRVIEVRRNSVPDGGFVLIYSDITERKRSEAEIHAARDAEEAAYRDLKAVQANLIQARRTSAQVSPSRSAESASNARTSSSEKPSSRPRRNNKPMRS